MELMKAVQSNNLELVRSLVRQGADKDQVDEEGYSPLWWACCDGFKDVAQYLVEQGAKVDKASNHGETPLLVVAAAGRLEICHYLLEQGADRDKADDEGYSPLHYAAYNGHQEIVMLLMSYGADLNARTKDGQLPIEMNGQFFTEEIKQAIRDEPRRRMDEAPGKRATEQDRHPNTAEHQEAREEVEQSNKLPGAVAGEETKVAEEDEDSEPSDGEDDSYGMKTRG